MKAPFLIRDLCLGDLDQVLILNRANEPAVGAADANKLRRLFDLSCIALAGESQEGELLAFCLVLPPGTAYESVNYRWFEARYQDYVYLDRVAVQEHARAQGLGRALYDAVAARTRASTLALEVNLRPRNDSSLAFHQRLGFVEVGQQETPYGVRVSMQIKSLRIP